MIPEILKRKAKSSMSALVKQFKIEVKKESKKSGTLTKDFLDSHLSQAVLTLLMVSNQIIPECGAVLSFEDLTYLNRLYRSWVKGISKVFPAYSDTFYLRYYITNFIPEAKQEEYLKEFKVELLKKLEKAPDPTVKEEADEVSTESKPVDKV